jgi:integrase
MELIDKQLLQAGWSSSNGTLIAEYPLKPEPESPPAEDQFADYVLLGRDGRILAILILDTGLRSGKEALALKWEDIDFANGSIRIKQSKTLAGIRNVPMSSRCKVELMRWRQLLGPEFSEYVFANPQYPQAHLADVRSAWTTALKAAGLAFFWLYDLRHTFASRLTETGVSPIFVAQIMGHASPNILQTYAKANEEYRRAAIDSLESHREDQCARLKDQDPRVI